VVDLQYSHLKPGSGYIEQVEIEWLPRRQDDSLSTNGALHLWTEKLLTAMDKHGRPMRLVPEQIRRQLKIAGFVDIQESSIKVCYSPWADDKLEREVASWFNIGLSHALTALSYKPMIEHLGMSKYEVDQLCSDVFEEICSLRSKLHCTL
jgi:hypothetical protein